MAKFAKTNSRAAKMSVGQVMLIRALYEQGRTQSSLCREFGISLGQVGRIVRGESWQVLPGVPGPSDEEVAAAARRALAVQQEVDSGAGMRRLQEELLKQQPSVNLDELDSPPPNIQPGVEVSQATKDRVAKILGKDKL